MTDPANVQPPEDPKALVKNANDLKQARQAKKTARMRELDAQVDIKNLMSTKSGRRLAWRFMTEARVFDSIATIDPYLAMRSLGRRDMGLMLLLDTQTLTPNEYGLMVKEAKEI